MENISTVSASCIQNPKRLQTSSKVEPQGQDEGLSYLKLLSTPTPTVLLKLKQKKSLFLNAIVTAQNYFGAPTKSCRSDFYDLLKYVETIFKHEAYINKRDIYERSKNLPKPNFFVLVNIQQANLYGCVKLRPGDSLFCLVGTNSGFMSKTRNVDASFEPHWNEEFLICCNNDSSLVVELFAKPKTGRPYSLGKATKDFDFIPDNQVLNLMFVRDNRFSRSTGCFLRLKCAFKGEEPIKKQNVIYRHLLLCYMVFEHNLYELGNLPWQAKQATENSPYGKGLERVLDDNAVTFLHQHAVQSGLTPYENVICCFLVINQCFLKASNADLDVVIAVLESMTLMGSWPQKPLDTILQETLTSELSASVKCCARHLYTLPGKLKQNEDETMKQLERVVRFLHHLEQFYNPDVISHVMVYMRHGACFEHEKLSELKMSSEKLTERALRKVIEELHDILDVLWKADFQFNQEADWNITYTSIVYKSLDANLARSLESLMTRLTQGSPTLPHNGLDYQMQIFGLISELISEIILVVQTVSDDQMNLTNCLGGVNDEAFLSYMRLVTERHSAQIASWAEDEGNYDDNQFMIYTRDLLQQWKKLLGSRPIAPTIAMLRVFREKCIKLIKRLEDKLRSIVSYSMCNKMFISDTHHNLRKIRDIVVCIDIVTREVEKYGINQITGIRTEMIKLRVEPALRDIVESLETDQSPPDFVEFLDELGVGDNLHTKLINYFCP